MPFGIVGWTGPGMRQVVGFGDRSTEKVFGGEFGARHCNQCGLYGVRVQQRREAPCSQITLGRLVLTTVNVRRTSVGIASELKDIHTSSPDVNMNYIKVLFLDVSIEIVNVKHQSDLSLFCFSKCVHDSIFLCFLSLVSDSLSRRSVRFVYVCYVL